MADSPLSRRRWIIWSAYTLVWTVALVFPVSESANLHLEEVLLGRKYVVTKLVHIAAYAAFAILSGWLRAPVRHRLLLLAFIMIHATVTELIQLRLSTRSGTLNDVAYDHLGIILGLVASWKWWREGA